MRWRTAWLIVVALGVAACGDDGGAGSAPGATARADGVGPRIAAIDPCTLLTDEEVGAVMGRELPSEPGSVNGGFISCSWNTGDVIVTIADQPTIVLAPGEDECPSADIGEISVACEGRVKFWVDGVHVSVSTINPGMETAQLEALARTIPTKLTG